MTRQWVAAIVLFTLAAALVIRAIVIGRRRRPGARHTGRVALGNVIVAIGMGAFAIVIVWPEVPGPGAIAIVAVSAMMLGGTWSLWPTVSGLSRAMDRWRDEG